MSITTPDTASNAAAGPDGSPSAPSPPLRTLTAAVIGGGKISEQHLGVLRSMEGVELGGVCDLSPALARFTAERFGAVGWHTDHRAMLERTRADVVHVLTPPATHDRIVRDCLDAGRHVIVEKPVALSNEAFRSLWDHAARRGLRLVENHNYRFNTPIQRLEQAIAAGRIGKVEEVGVRMVLDIRSGGRYADLNLPHPSHQLPAGIIHEFITHLAYLLLELMPEDALDRMEAIRAAWRNHGGGELFRYDDLDASLLCGSVHGRIRFTSRQWPDCLAVRVRGSDGAATAELFQPSLRIVTRRGVGQHLAPLVNALAEAKSTAGSGLGSLWQKIRNRTPYEGLGRFLALTYGALRAGREPPVGFPEMDRTTRLIDALLAPEHRV